jgi:chaperonin cofactor prefoldin
VERPLRNTSKQAKEIANDPKIEMPGAQEMVTDSLPNDLRLPLPARGERGAAPGGKGSSPVPSDVGSSASQVSNMSSAITELETRMKSLPTEIKTMMGELKKDVNDDMVAAWKQHCEGLQARNQTLESQAAASQARAEQLQIMCEKFELQLAAANQALYAAISRGNA